MTNRLSRVLACLHLGAALYLVVACVLFWFLHRGVPAQQLPLVLVALLLCGTLTVFHEAVVAGLRRNAAWAWVAAVVLFILYLPSIFFPVGALGLWALLHPATRVELGLAHGPHVGLGGPARRKVRAAMRKARR